MFIEVCCLEAASACSSRGRGMFTECSWEYLKKRDLLGDGKTQRKGRLKWKLSKLVVTVKCILT